MIAEGSRMAYLEWLAQTAELVRLDAERRSGRNVDERNGRKMEGRECRM